MTKLLGALVSDMAHKAAPKLPRLRMREELLKVLRVSSTAIDYRTASAFVCDVVCFFVGKAKGAPLLSLILQSAPELARLLGEDIDGEQTALFEQHSKTGTSNRGPGYSIQGGGSHATSPDNPALAAEEELTEEDELVSVALSATSANSEVTVPHCRSSYTRLSVHPYHCTACCRA